MNLTMGKRERKKTVEKNHRKRGKGYKGEKPKKTFKIILKIKMNFQ